MSLGELDKTITITAELIYRKNITLKDAEAELEEVRTRIEGAEQVKENKMESAFVALLEQIKDKELLKENLERTIENLKKDKRTQENLKKKSRPRRGAARKKTQVPK